MVCSFIYNDEIEYRDNLTAVTVVYYIGREDFCCGLGV